MSINTWEQGTVSLPKSFTSGIVSVVKTPILWAVVALFAVSLLVAPGSVSQSAVDAMLPFAGIMALAAVGQTLVIMLKGIDLSVPGLVTVGAVVVTQFTKESGSLVWAIVVTLLIAAAVGAINGLVIAYFSVSPLVVTLAMNSILMGSVLAYTGGTPVPADPALSDFAIGKTFSISNIVLTVLIVVAIISILISRTVWGRRLISVGSNDVAARAAGVRYNQIQISGYVIAALLYAAGGILLAGLLKSPNTLVGGPYLMPVIAAVVLGGTSLLGGRGRIWGTVLGALFLSQLSQLVGSIGAPSSVQFIIQAVVIFVAVVVSTIRSGTALKWFRFKKSA